MELTCFRPNPNRNPGGRPKSEEMTHYMLPTHVQTRAMLDAVREEMGVLPPLVAASTGTGVGGATAAASERGIERLRTDELVGVHVRRGDKRDLGAKERGEPFSDEQYVQAALRLADELGASGSLLASLEPEPNPSPNAKPKPASSST